MKEVVLDTETTGISVKDGHRLVEIGCIELDNLIPTKNRFHSYLNPERKVSEKALEVHGYTDEFLATQKKFLEVVEQFLEFIKDKRLIIHNAEFDLSHLNNELAILGKKKINKKKDILVFIQSKQSDILKRLRKRKNFNQNLLKIFKNIQYSVKYKKKKSNFVIKNDFTNKTVNEGVKNILKEIV